MDTVPIFTNIFSAVWWLVPLAILAAFIKTPWFKGVFGESLIRLTARWFLPANTYRSFHNVTLPTSDGTTQIDHVFVSRFGVFVVETKHMKGWIFGKENQAQWTQKIYKQTFRFQNPLRQNYKHVKALQEALDLAADKIHSVVVFTGNRKFKTTMPKNVTYGGGYIRYIRSFREPVLSEEEVRSAGSQIQSGRLEPSRKTHREHVERLKSRADPTAERNCPKCGSKMVLRTAKRGVNAGSQFWGCSAYPQCKSIQKVT